MPSKSICCHFCSSRTSSKNRFKVKLDINKYVYACNVCRKNHSKKVSAITSSVIASSTITTSAMTTSPITTSSITSSTLTASTVQLDIKSFGRTNFWCFICHQRNNYKIAIGQKLITKFFIEEKILIPKGNRCCVNHINSSGYFTKDAIKLMKSQNIKSNSTFKPKNLTKLMFDLTNECNKRIGKLNIEDEDNLNEHDYYNLLGVTKLQFRELLGFVVNKTIRFKRTALAALLLKLRCGLSFSKICSMINHYNDKGNLSKIVKMVKTDLIHNFVPLHLGVDHVSREYLIENQTRLLTKELFNKTNLVLILDGTYIYCEKSSGETILLFFELIFVNFQLLLIDNQLQRKLYSMHKYRHLVKFMVIVTTTGYILDVKGPYYGDSKNNDANITKDIMINTDLKGFINEDDVFIVDRGFRDVLDLLSEMSIKTYAPAFLKSSEKQFTTETANKARHITKVRWVVEAINGKIKKFELFNKAFNNSQMPSVNDYLLIVCAILNAFRGAIIKDYDGEIELAQRILEQTEKENELLKLIESKQLPTTKSYYKKIDSINLFDFPILNYTDLTNITLGCYQLKMAKSYISEHFDKDGSFEIFGYKLCSDILKCKIESRHKSVKKYDAWIKYDKDAILNYYCTCKVGSRVVGCCSHVASIITYLGYYIYMNIGPKCQDIKNSLLDAKKNF